ncbi:MAG: FlgD immunoglobulin-like domain containing protein [Gemmatimonadota bacterium]
MRALPRPASWGRVAVLALAIALSGVAGSRDAAAQSPPSPGFRLEQNFPNPFTPGVNPTIFTYEVPAEARVTLTIFNLLGQEVVTLVDGVEKKGVHRVAWEGLDAGGRRVPAGLYWYQVRAGDQGAVRRLRVRDPADAGAGEAPAPGGR